MLKENLVKPDQLIHFFQKIKPALIRYPALDPDDFEKSIHHFLENTL